MSLSPPPADVLAAILGPQTHVIRRVDVYEEDGSTIYMQNVPLVSGSISVDMGRSERRVLDLVLDNTDDSIDHRAGAFWYDKIIKPYRGAVAYDPDTAEPTEWEIQLGEFMIDGIRSRNFPHQIAVTGRDYTKKLLNSKFKYATTFNQGARVADVIKTIAQNGGISKFILPLSSGSLGTDYTFEAGTERWQAISDLAIAFGYEVYFDAAGFMVVRDFQDPITSPIVFSFEIGEAGTLVSWEKASSDSRLYNVIVVKGESSTVVPYTATAENHEPSSPTSVEEIGERVYQYSSPYITSEAQAQEVADKFLRVHSLEEFNLGLESIVLPWLEAGSIIQFNDEEGQAMQFLLASFTVPLELASMPLTGKRVTVVG